MFQNYLILRFLYLKFDFHLRFFKLYKDWLFEEYYKNQPTIKPATLKSKAELTPLSNEFLTSTPTTSTATTSTITSIIILNDTTKALTESLKKTIPLEYNTTSLLFQTTQEGFLIDVEKKQLFFYLENRKSIGEFRKRYHFENPSSSPIHCCKLILKAIQCQVAVGRPARWPHSIIKLFWFSLFYTTKL